MPLEAFTDCELEELVKSRPDPACSVETNESHRMFLMALVHPYEGSTALASIIMGSENLATLCSFDEWQCEGRKIIEAKSDEGIHHVNVLDAYSAVWNLSKPVLFDKSPNMLVSAKEFYEEHLASAYIPRRMAAENIQTLSYAYIMMWRPFCLGPLSSHFPDRTSRHELLQYAFMEVKRLKRLVIEHEWMVQNGLDVMILNFGSVVFKPSVTAYRLQAFLPCLPNLSVDYIPRLGIDVYPGNDWKASGSVRSFGKSVDPVALGYDREAETCSGHYSFSQLLRNFPNHLAQAESYEGYLRSQARRGSE